MLIRPISRDDLPALLALAASTGVGVTTLPANEERLSRRIEGAVRSLTSALPLAESGYVFVLEDDDQNHEVVGICGIEAAVGLVEPWYNYRVGLAVHASSEIGMYRQLQTLFLTNDLTGSAELCSLFLRADYRHSNNGSLLSKCRYLFMAEFPDRFAPRVIAEMRGVSDETGHSPFWESLGRHFFKMDFSQADYLTGLGNKSFIAELMPQHPVYTAFLSAEARNVVGQVHDNTRPALAMLQSEGFRYNGYVDIFDAGPTVECELGQIRAVRDSRLVSAQLAEVPQGDGRLWLVSNRRLTDFRLCLVQGEPDVDAFCLPAADLARLQVHVGDSLRVVPLSAKS